MKCLCFRCEELYPEHLMEIEDSGRLVCICCYLENPSPADVDGVFAEVAARYIREVGL